MTTPIKGFPSNNKVSTQRDLAYANVEPVNLQKDGLAVKTYQYCRVVAADAVEALSTTSIIVATAHVAQRGDVISFTSGALSGQEFVVSSIATNSITLSEVMTAAPAAADTFNILRNKTPVVDATGNVVFSPGPLQYVKNGVTTQVSIDTAVAANSTPLPVLITGAGGSVTINAGDLDVNIKHNGADPSSVKIGDGTSVLDVVVEDAASVGGEKGILAMAVRNSAGGATTNTDGDYGTLTIDNTGRLRVDATVTESATAADGAAAPAFGKMVAGLDGSGNLQYLSTDTNGLLNTNLHDGSGTSITVGQKAMAASVPVVIASNQGVVPVSFTGLTQKLPFIRNDYTGTSVTTAAYVQLSASLPSNISQITLFDSSGQTLMLALGAAASEVDQLLIPPGGFNGAIPFVATAGQRLSIKAVSADATVGEIDINLFA